MSTDALGIVCPWCNERLKLEFYDMNPHGEKKRFALRAIVYCDNDECYMQPCSLDGSPSKAIADARAWGSKALATEGTNK